jgi:PII-like signaling protein
MFAESASSGAAGYRGYIGYYHNATTASGRMALSSQGYMTFLTSSGERMRIDSSGNMMVGKTAVGAATLGAEMRPDGFVGSAKASSVNGSITFGAYSTTASQYQFYVGMAGTIYARATSISSLSDERRKENIVDLETGLPEVMALKPRRFDWKDGSETNVAGFIAQEVETVLPDLIGEWEDENNDDLKSVKMGDMLPTLVKAIQEQQEQIEQLKTEIQTLKGE